MLATTPITRTLDLKTGADEQPYYSLSQEASAEAAEQLGTIGRASEELRTTFGAGSGDLRSKAAECYGPFAPGYLLSASFGRSRRESRRLYEFYEERQQAADSAPSFDADARWWLDPTKHRARAARSQCMSSSFLQAAAARSTEGGPPRKMMKLVSTPSEPPLSDLLLTVAARAVAGPSEARDHRSAAV